MLEHIRFHGESTSAETRADALKCGELCGIFLSERGAQAAARIGQGLGGHYITASDNATGQYLLFRLPEHPAQNEAA